MVLDDESKKLSESTGDDDANVVVAAAATVAAAAGLSVTALRRHVPRDLGGPFQDGSLVVAMQDLSLLSLSLSLSLSISIYLFSTLRRFFSRSSTLGFPSSWILRRAAPSSRPLARTAVETSKLRE